MKQCCENCKWKEEGDSWELEYLGDVCICKNGPKYYDLVESDDFCENWEGE